MICRVLAHGPGLLVIACSRSTRAAPAPCAECQSKSSKLRTVAAKGESPLERLRAALRALEGASPTDDEVARLARIARRANVEAEGDSEAQYRAIVRAVVAALDGATR